MKKVKVIDGSNGNYMLADENGKIYKSKMWFKSFTSKPQLGDYIFISETVLDDSEEKITPKTYGPFTALGFARKPERMTDTDFIIIVNDKGLLVYQRYYG